ncbi:MAG: phosphoribosylformylglycinamidine cyclo-ligase [Candidatus Limnocylindrales bacterium]
MTRTAYAQAGVDVDAGERAVALMRAHAQSLSGEFASISAVPAGMVAPLVISATDGVGTKTNLAGRLGRYDTVGQDLVAMCADDVVCHGAAPAFFLDYLAVGRIVPERVAEIVGGIAAACRQVGCDLLGGETAEHPGVMAVDDFDLAGFCVGFVERDELIDGSAARPGDVVVGLASSGLHSNGFSLVRRLVDDGRLALTAELLTPTRLYAPAVMALLRELRGRGLRVGGLAHVTGGGLARNLARGVGRDVGVRVRPSAWQQPAIFDAIASAAEMDAAEMRATFNCGIGFAAIVEPRAASDALQILAENGIDAWPIGEVAPVKDLGGVRYLEA